MDEKKEDFELIKLEDISEFELDQKEFNDLNNQLDEEFKFNTLLYSDEEKKYMKFKGNIKEGNYHGRGILYEYYGLVKYDGFFKNGKKEGFGRYFNKDYCVVGFFSNDEFKKGIIKYKDIKKYECELKNGKKSVIGIEYLHNGNIKRKMEYEYDEGWDSINLYPKIQSYGILYDGNNNIAYKGLLKNFKPKDSNYIDIYNKKGNKIYSGSISNYVYHGEGIEYYNDSDIIHFKGLFNNQIYEKGLINDPKGNKIYEGIFINNIPKECKNIKLFNLDGNIIYEGDLLDGLYYNYGKIFENNKMLYNGGFLKGKYNKFGKLYDKDENLIYEGEFFEGIYHGEGNLLIKDNIYMNEFNENLGSICEGKIYIKSKFSKGVIEDDNASITQKTKLGVYLYFEGSIKNNLYNGFGKIYYKNKNIFFQGNFKNGKIEGKGAKYYENGAKKIEGIFKNINSCTGIYYNPEGKKIFNGEIINDIPYNCNNIIIYHDNTNKKYEGNIKLGKYEDFGIVYDYFINNKILYKGKFKNNNFIIENFDNLKDKEIIISLYSYQRGYHSCEFVEKLLTGEVGSFSSYTEGTKIYSFQNNGNKFEIRLEFFDDLYKFKNGIFRVKVSKIIIFVIEIKEYEKIDEEYICELIKSKPQESLVYIIIKGIEKEINYETYEIFREQAKNLITNCIIDKYFEVDLFNGDGLDNIEKNLQFDSVTFQNKKIIQKNLQVYAKINQSKKEKNEISPIFEKKLNKYMNF